MPHTLYTHIIPYPRLNENTDGIICISQLRKVRLNEWYETTKLVVEPGYNPALFISRAPILSTLAHLAAAHPGPAQQTVSLLTQPQTSVQDWISIPGTSNLKCALPSQKGGGFRDLMQNNAFIYWVEKHLGSLFQTTLSIEFSGICRAHPELAVPGIWW